MSAWPGRILREFPKDLSRFWIAADPDDVLLDEQILAGLREQGFGLVPFDDPLVFRAEYEERFREPWDQAEPAAAEALVLHLRDGAIEDLPWDYLRDSRRVRLSLADLFPKLSYGVVRQLGAEHRDALFDAQEIHAPQALGEAATKEFILTHIFEVSPHLVSRPEILWRELLRLHHGDKALPPALASHFAAVLKTKPVFRELDIEALIGSRRSFLETIQAAWTQFLAGHGVEPIPGTGAPQDPKASPALSIPLDHPDVRGFLDQMFQDGSLERVRVAGLPAGLPPWAKVGLNEEAAAKEAVTRADLEGFAAELPAEDSSYREWLHLARRLGELMFRFHALPAEQAETLRSEVLDLQCNVDERMRGWILRHFGDLSSLPAAKAPVMVHHVPRFLAH